MLLSHYFINTFLFNLYSSFISDCLFYYIAIIYYSTITDIQYWVGNALMHCTQKSITAPYISCGRFFLRKRKETKY